MGDFERALAFVKAIDERASTRVERFRYGTACLRPELPRIWSRNFVRVKAGVGEEQLEPLLREADRLHASAGLEHRRLVFGDEAGAGAAQLLARSGWRVQGTRVMVHRGNVEAPPHGVGAREVEAEALREASEAAARDNPDVRDEQTVQQLLKAHEAVAAATRERCFAAEVDGSVASFCHLYSDGETAQIEEVGTLAAFRNRGLAGAVVSTALAAARQSHSLTFLLADEDDWPKSWYERLGFERVAMMWEALKT